MPKQSSTAYLSLELGYLEEEGASIQIDTPEFQTWLQNNDSFRVEAGDNSYRARKESYTGIDYWYGVKKVAGKLHKRFIGKTEELTGERLAQIANSIRQPSSKASATASDTVAPLLVDDKSSNKVSDLEARIEVMQEQLTNVQQQLAKLLELQGKKAA